MPGRINDDDIEQLRERADIVDVIGEHTQLKKAGRTFKGLCPFHQEKTPSFNVDPDKRLYYCHGCGEGGDIFSFLRKAEGLSFTESAERLAARYGVQLHFNKSGGEGGTRRSLVAANKAAALHYSTLLFSAPEAEAARRYMEGRGFTSDDARAWALGFSPPAKDATYRHLLSEKFTSKQIVDAGLAVVTDAGEHRDRFRGRLMFPVADVTGEVVGFGARSLGDDQPKYLNSPETSLYRKAQILYALDRARKEITNSGQAVVVEGYTDVIALHKVGVTSVATCGTALGEEHLSALKRFCDRVTLAFDSDAAGAVASERAFGLHEKLGLEVLVAPIPAGKDPADVALTEGADAINSILEGAIPLMQFVLEAEIGRHRLDTAEAKAKAVRGAVAKLSWEPNRVARGEHAFWLARRIGVQESAVQREIAESGRRSSTSHVRPEIRQPGHVKVEREALALFMDSSLFSDEIGRFEDDHFSQPEHRVIFGALRELKEVASGSLDGAQKLQVRLEKIMDLLPDDAVRRLAAELALVPPVTDNPEEVFSRLEEFRLMRHIEALRAKLDGLDPVGDAAGYDALFEELMQLEERRRQFEEGR